jgi:hypothetical protein
LPAAIGSVLIARTIKKYKEQFGKSVSLS